MSLNNPWEGWEGYQPVNGDQEDPRYESIFLPPTQAELDEVGNMLYALSDNIAMRRLQTCIPPFIRNLIDQLS